MNGLAKHSLSARAKGLNGAALTTLSQADGSVTFSIVQMSCALNLWPSRLAARPLLANGTSCRGQVAD